MGRNVEIWAAWFRFTPEYKIGIRRNIKRPAACDIKFYRSAGVRVMSVFIKRVNFHVLVTDPRPFESRIADAILLAALHRRGYPRRLGAAAHSINAEPRPLCVKAC